jgi:hypothetical protein
MSPKQIIFWTWVKRVLMLLAGIGGVLSAAEQLPDWLQKYAALAVAILGVCSSWVAGLLPAVKSKVLPTAILGLLLVLLALQPACKTPPLATLYRTHALLVSGRDAGGKMLHTTQSIAVKKCRDTHKAPVPEWRAKLIACLEKAVAPLRPWVKHIKPALTAAADALWLALEAAYIIGDSTLTKSDQALAVVCKSLTAAETTLKQYADQLGELHKMIAGAVAGGKVLVCR